VVKEANKAVKEGKACERKVPRDTEKYFKITSRESPNQLLED